MGDPVVTVGPDGRELARADDTGVLPRAPLEDLLDSTSRDALGEALGAAPVHGLELVTLDGRVLDATVLPSTDRAWGIVLRDVTRYAQTAQSFGGMALALARRNRDLKTLYEAAGTLDATLDLAEIARLTCAMVAEYLDAEQVAIHVVGTEFQWADSGTAATPTGTLPLRTPRGEIGQLRWWRGDDLLPNEREVLPLLVSRAAIGLDHALLLSNAEDRAARDPLTGLLNRGGARHALAALVPPFAVALIDLDHFKQVNDVHGHAEGDRVLREVAGILERGRGSDVKARWGGEEFLVALDRGTVARAVRWMERTLQEVREQVRAGGRAVTFSAGVALVTSEGLDPALVAADGALYRAKAGGRARVLAAEAVVGPLSVRQQREVSSGGSAAAETS